MAKFLTTTRISAELEDIIKNADDYLYLISPFLKVSKRLKELLESKSRSVNIHVIYGKSELQPDEGEWLQRLDTVRTSYRKDLHAKCYLNEDTALLTSMNLYEFSEKNNDEMGVLVSREDDEDLYNEIFKESKAILDKSEQVRMTFTRDEPVEDSEAQPRAKKTRGTAGTPKNGFCIRCGDTVPANPDRPYCERCFKSWNRYKNETYGEKGCHTCGKEHEATMSRPLCLTCYRKHKNWVDSTIK